MAPLSSSAGSCFWGSNYNTLIVLKPQKKETFILSSYTEKFDFNADNVSLLYNHE